MRVVRFSGVCLLASYLLLHLLFPTPWSELIAYNIAPIAGLVAISCAPHISDAIAKPATAIAIALWTCGSVIASAGALFSISHSYSNASSILYLLFYPLAMIGLPRLLAVNSKLSLIELVDSSIFGLGLTTLGSALIVKPVLPHFDGNVGETFFAIIAPVTNIL
jgi:hypothetical protein